MAHRYAGVLGLLAFTTALVRGVVHGSSAASALWVAWLSLLAFAQFAKQRPPAASAFAAGGALAIIAALYVATPQPFAPIALAAGLPALALFARLRSEPGLSIALELLSLALLARLVVPELYIVTASTPAHIALVFVPAIACALLAAIILERVRKPYPARAA